MNPKFVLPKIGELPITASIESICKFEKVPTRITSTEREGVMIAADIVVEAIKSHSGNRLFSLGLSTGRTPLGLYAESQMPVLPHRPQSLQLQAQRHGENR